MPAAELYRIADAEDPKAEMLKAIGDLADVSGINGARVLVWTYIRPRKTKGGIFLTDKEVKEDLWQGAVGYVLKLGPLAFKPDDNNNFGGFEAKAGDWVTFRPGDARRVQIRGVDCRIVEDALIDMVITDPDMITHRQ